jgi:hypothetical protein
VTGKISDRAIVMSTFLSHEGSLTTFMAYVNLRINYDIKVKERLSIPPEHMVRLFQTDLQIHNDRIAKLEALVETLMKNNTQQPTLLIKVDDGTIETAEQRYIAAVTQLISQGIKPSALNIKNIRHIWDVSQETRRESRHCQLLSST